MSHGGAAQRGNGTPIRRSDSQAMPLANGTQEAGSSRKYELKNYATGSAAELISRSGTIGPEVLDISHLTRDLGVFTYDPGFMATASTESKITYIDGDAGMLLYRGYPVEQLAEKSSFLEVADLLINGALPTKAQLDAFQASITRRRTKKSSP